MVIFSLDVVDNADGVDDPTADVDDALAWIADIPDGVVDDVDIESGGN